MDQQFLVATWKDFMFVAAWFPLVLRREAPESLSHITLKHHFAPFFLISHNAGFPSPFPAAFASVFLKEIIGALELRVRRDRLLGASLARAHLAKWASGPSGPRGR